MEDFNTMTLTGQSKKRNDSSTTDKDIAIKTKLAIEKGSTVMACIGEEREKLNMEQADKINARQLQAIADELTEA